MRIIFTLILGINLMYFIYCSCPTGKPVNTISECIDLSNSDKLCCLLRNSDNTPKMCYELDSIDYKGEKIKKYGVVTYSIDCGSAEPNTNNGSNTNNNTYTNDNTDTNDNSKDTPTLPDIDTSKESYYGIGGSTCGNENPKQQSDCSFISTPKNSCCFYSYKEVSGCYWIGTKFNGRYNEGAFDLYCNAEMVVFWKKGIFILFVLYFLF